MTVRTTGWTCTPHLAEGRRARRRLVLALPRGEIFVLVLVPSLLLVNHSRDAPPALRRRLELYDRVTHVALPRIVGASGGHSSLRCRYNRKALQWGEVAPSSSGPGSCHGAARRSGAGQPQRCPTCSIPLACSSQTVNGAIAVGQVRRCPSNAGS